MQKLIVAFVCLFLVAPCQAGTIYVDGDANGANDGSSWADAYNYLLSGAALSGDEIWVAEGTYRPATAGGSRNAAFWLKNGVAIKGGYAGFGEPDPNVRDIQAYETILSGDLDGNDVDVNDPCDLLTEPTRAENSYHVVTGSTGASAVLDGFTITGGNADGSGYPDYHNYGGGMYNQYNSPTVTNCTFIGNSALNDGGGMYNDWPANPTVSNCTFSGNFANLGGGLCNDGTSPTFTNCTFIGNVAFDGGGIFNTGNLELVKCTFIGNRAVSQEPFSGGGGIANGVAATPKLINCIFSGNSSASKAGGMRNTFSSPTLTNCTFAGNSADTVGGGMYNHQSAPTLTNCIFWGNIDSGGVNENAQIFGGWPVVKFSCIQDDDPNDIYIPFGSETNIDEHPYFVDFGYWANANDPNIVVEPNDPNAIWIDGDYHLLANSPCIDAGDPNYIAEPNETDLDGSPRIINGRIDMGAYEFFNTPPFACIVGGDKTIEAGNDCEARVTLDGSCSSDADSTPGTNDDIEYFDWYEQIDPCDPNSDIFLGSGEIIECNLPLGEHDIILEVTDKAGAFDTNEVTITVEDTTPPEFSLSVEPNVLWPPNHKMVEITPSWEVSDNCDELLEVTLVSITMDEEDDAKGDGHTSDDIQVNDNEIWLRAERSGTGSGRIYTITYQAVDGAGNVVVDSATVTVPHDKR